VLQSNVAARRRFQLVLITPSHYDDDGYVIRWWRAMTPSNSLAAVYGIAADCAERRVLGPDVDIDIEVIDETNTRIDIAALLSRYRRHDDFGCVALISVQSNQYPRALDIARPFRQLGLLWPSEVFAYRDACRCWMAAQWISTFATTWVSPYSPVKPRGVSNP
jgi:hypothetical protein